MARIENHKYSIEEAFRECFYIVPDYQREYVWTDKEVHQLLEDIGEQIDTGTTREYFIGTVLVSPTEQKKHYEVIDGQQRLTTFFLLLCALKHLFQGEPQRQMLSGLISTSYVDSDGEVCTTLKLEPRYESAGKAITPLPRTTTMLPWCINIPSWRRRSNSVSASWNYLRNTTNSSSSSISTRKIFWMLRNEELVGRRKINPSSLIVERLGAGD